MSLLDNEAFPTGSHFLNLNPAAVQQLQGEEVQDGMWLDGVGTFMPDLVPHDTIASMPPKLIEYSTGHIAESGNPAELFVMQPSRLRAMGAKILGKEVMSPIEIRVKDAERHFIPEMF